MVVQSPAPQILSPSPPTPCVHVNRNTKVLSGSLPRAKSTPATVLNSMHYIVAALATTIAVVCILDTQSKPSHIRVLSPAYLAQLHIEMNALRHAQAKVAAIVEAQTLIP